MDQFVSKNNIIFADIRNIMFWKYLYCTFSIANDPHDELRKNKVYDV